MLGSTKKLKTFLCKENKNINNIPVLNYGRNTGTYIYLDNISHEISTETYT